MEQKIKIEIGDTVLIHNTKNNIIEEYTIAPTYHEWKIIGTDVTKGKNFGRTIYQDVLASKSDIKNGIILSESDLAKKTIGLSIGSTFLFLDEDLKEIEYTIVDIQKNTNY